MSPPQTVGKCMVKPAIGCSLGLEYLLLKLVFDVLVPDSGFIGSWWSFWVMGLSALGTLEPPCPLSLFTSCPKVSNLLPWAPCHIVLPYSSHEGNCGVLNKNTLIDQVCEYLVPLGGCLGNLRSATLLGEVCHWCVGGRVVL